MMISFFFEFSETSTGNPNILSAELFAIYRATEDNTWEVNSSHPLVLITSDSDNAPITTSASVNPPPFPEQVNPNIAALLPPNTNRPLCMVEGNVADPGAEFYSAVCVIQLSNNFVRLFFVAESNTDLYTETTIETAFTVNGVPVDTGVPDGTQTKGTNELNRILNSDIVVSQSALNQLGVVTTHTFTPSNAGPVVTEAEIVFNNRPLPGAEELVVN